MSSKKKKVQKREIPAWLEQGSQQAVTRAREIADRPYQAYEDQRVADLDPNEQRGYDLARQTGVYEEDLNRSRAFAEQSGQSWVDLTQEERDAYMNPYIKSALDPAAREIREQGLQQRSQVGQQAAMAGAFGGSRATLLETETDRATTQELGDLYGEGFARAYESAGNRFDKDRVAARGASDAFRAIGGQAQQQLTQQVQNLLVTGGLKRSLEQANLDFDFMQFIEARDWDVTNLQPLLATLSSVPHGETMTTTTSGGTFQAILGAAATVAGAYFTGGMSLFAQGAAGAAGAVAGGGDRPAGFEEDRWGF